MRTTIQNPKIKILGLTLLLITATFSDVYQEIGLTANFPSDWLTTRISNFEITAEDTSDTYKGLFTLSVYESILDNNDDGEDWSITAG